MAVPRPTARIRPVFWLRRIQQSHRPGRCSQFHAPTRPSGKSQDQAGASIRQPPQYHVQRRRCVPPMIPRLLVWSSLDEAGIARTEDAWRDHPGLVSPPHWRKGHDYLGDVAYTLAARRSHFPWRAMAVVASADSLVNVADLMSGPTRAAASPQLGLVFTGVGLPGMEYPHYELGGVTNGPFSPD